MNNDNNDNNNDVDNISKDNKEEEEDNEILFFFKSMKCHTFSEPQARPDLNDDDDNDVNDNDNKEEEEDEKLFFSKVSSVIPFRNHNLGLI